VKVVEFPLAIDPLSSMRERGLMVRAHRFAHFPGGLAFEHPFGFDLDQPTGQLSASTIGSAMTGSSLPLLMVRAGREFFQLACG
jgi:hypothetical protein